MNIKSVSSAALSKTNIDAAARLELIRRGGEIWVSGSIVQPVAVLNVKPSLLLINEDMN